MLAPALAVASIPPTPPPPAAVTSISVSNTSVPENIAAGANAFVLTTNLTVFGISVDWVLAGTDAPNWQLSAPSGASVIGQRSATGTLSEGVDENLTITAQRPGTDVYPDPAQDIVLTVTAPVTEVLLTTLTMNNLGSETLVAGTVVEAGHLFKATDIPDGHRAKLTTSDGTELPVQQDSETYFDDDSLRWADLFFKLPADLTAGSSLEVNVYDADSAPNRTAPASVAATVALIVAMDDKQARVTFDSGHGDDEGTWIGSRNHALGGTLFDATTGYGSNPDRGYRVLKHGPHVTEVEWFSKLYLSPTTTSYHYQLRAEGVLRYYHDSGLIQERIRSGPGNLFGAQGTHGSTTWETKYPVSVAVYRGATKLREFLDTDSFAPRMPAPGAPWWGDEHLNWDWSDGATRDCWPQWNMTYAMQTKTLPWFDITRDSSQPDIGTYLPAWRMSWPQDLHQGSDGNEDPRIGPISWPSLAAMKYPTHLGARRSERKYLFSLPPTYQIDETTGLRPLKGDPTKSYGAYGSARNRIGRTTIWATPSPACQIRDEQFGVWSQRYQEGLCEASHWPNFWFHYAVTGDTCALKQLQDHHLALILNRGGYAGVDFTPSNGAQVSNGANVTDPVTGGYSYALYQQVRGTAWQLRNDLMASMFAPHFEYDHSNENGMSKWHRDRVQEEVRTMYAYAVYENTNRGSQWPGIRKAHLRPGQVSATTRTDASARVCHFVASYMSYMQWIIWRWIAAAGHTAAADIAQEYWEWGLEVYALEKFAGQSGCKHWTPAIDGDVQWYDSDVTDVPADIDEAVQSTAEAYGGGTYSCPSNVVSNAEGGYASIWQCVAGMNTQAPAGNYDADQIYDDFVTLRGGVSPVLKYSFGKPPA